MKFGNAPQGKPEYSLSKTVRAGKWLQRRRQLPRNDQVSVAVERNFSWSWAMASEARPTLTRLDMIKAGAITTTGSRMFGSNKICTIAMTSSGGSHGPKQPQS